MIEINAEAQHALFQRQTDAIQIPGLEQDTTTGSSTLPELSMGKTHMTLMFLGLQYGMKFIVTLDFYEEMEFAKFHKSNCSRL